MCGISTSFSFETVHRFYIIGVLAWSINWLSGGMGGPLSFKRSLLLREGAFVFYFEYILITVWKWVIVEFRVPYG
jgi:hypothetical protein